jgi:hypothetical protein
MQHSATNYFTWHHSLILLPRCLNVSFPSSPHPRYSLIHQLLCSQRSMSDHGAWPLGQVQEQDQEKAWWLGFSR